MNPVPSLSTSEKSGMPHGYFSLHPEEEKDDGPPSRNRSWTSYGARSEQNPLQIQLRRRDPPEGPKKVEE